MPADRHPVNIFACRFLLALCFAIAICLLFIISLTPYIYIIAHGRDTLGHSLNIFSKKLDFFLIETSLIKPFKPLTSPETGEGKASASYYPTHVNRDSVIF